MRRRILGCMLASILAVLPLGWSMPAQAQQADDLTVFAAASLTDVFKALGDLWHSRTGRTVRFSFASSSTLARQIEQGAPADLFASADQQWMDYLQERHLIVPSTRVSPIGNNLVLVAPAATATPITITRDTNILALLGPNGRLATGDPAHVPAGIYAKEALTWMGQWDAIAPRLAPADSVRSALLLVERGEAPYGIVYGTDAAISPGVKVVGTFPAESHPPVIYPFAVTKRAEGNAQAMGFLEFLTSPQATDVFRHFGFRVTARL